MTENCPTCGSKVKVVGNVTMSFKPLNEEVESLVEALRDIARGQLQVPDFEKYVVNKAKRALKNWEESHG